jgi:trigger factor
MAIATRKPTDTSKSEDTAGNADKPYEYKITDLEDSRKQLEIKVEAPALVAAMDKAYKKLSAEVEIPGFRPGKAPRNLVEAKLGARLYEEAINDLIPQITAMVMMETKLNPLDYAEYSVKKVSKDEGLEYTASFTAMPEVKIPDFSKIDVKREEPEVSEKEIEESFQRLKKSIVEKEEEGKSTGDDDSDSGSDSEKTKGQKESKKEWKKEKEVKIDWAKELLDEAIKTEEDVRERIKEIILQKKKEEKENEFVDNLVRKAIEKAEIKAPKNIVAAEAESMEKQYKERIEKLGMKVEDFLKTQQTDLDTMRENWRKDAEFKISTDLLFSAIASKHGLKVETADVDAELAKVTDEKTKSQYSTEQGRNYISSVLLRQRALQKLKELAGVEESKESKKSEKSSKKKTDKK